MSLPMDLIENSGIIILIMLISIHRWLSVRSNILVWSYSSSLKFEKLDFLWKSHDIICSRLKTHEYILSSIYQVFSFKSKWCEPINIPYIRDLNIVCVSYGEKTVWNLSIGSYSVYLYEYQYKTQSFVMIWNFLSRPSNASFQSFDIISLWIARNCSSLKQNDINWFAFHYFQFVL